MNDYENFTFYLVQGLHLNKLDFIHKGLVSLYEMDDIQKDTEYL